MNEQLAAMNTGNRIVLLALGTHDLTLATGSQGIRATVREISV